MKSFEKKENAIIVIRPTRLQQLKTKYNTEEQAKFYIKQNRVAFSRKKIMSKAPLMSKEEILAEEAIADVMVDQELDSYEKEDIIFNQTLSIVEKQVAKILKIKRLEQKYLSNYIFSEKDLIIVVGQDGLVANTAKYLNGLPIIGINPDPSKIDGVLLPYNRNNFMPAVLNVINNNFLPKAITMAQAKMDNGQTLLAFNDFFIGIDSHASAKYKIKYNNQEETQSSSGIIVSTGAGSTGWLSSFFNMTNGFLDVFAPNIDVQFTPIAHSADELMFVVREPFVSRTSSANIVVGKIIGNEILSIESNMAHNGVIFSDGIQSDFIEFNAGRTVEVSIAEKKAILA
ncbi:MAG: hypothetical protein JXR68_11670 [Bacteroidales bacterium]|nr:hypothetical protein [Bacteroidales bacterium]